eukprot:3979910-Amphidinium_carterae.2
MAQAMIALGETKYVRVHSGMEAIYSTPTFLTLHLLSPYFLMVAERSTRTTCTRPRTKTMKYSVDERHKVSEARTDTYSNKKFVEKRFLPTYLQLQQFSQVHRLAASSLS